MIGTKLLGLGVAAAAPVAGSVATYANFDDAIRAAGAVAGATGAAFDSLREKAKLLGATTSSSASEVASLMTELGRAGFSPKQIEEMTGAVMNLTRATGTDATLSSEIMAATIRQFSMVATDAVRVADGLTAAANKSFNSVESLGERSRRRVWLNVIHVAESISTLRERFDLFDSTIFPYRKDSRDGFAQEVLCRAASNSEDLLVCRIDVRQKLHDC